MIGDFIGVTYDVTGVSSMVVANGHIGGAVIGPAEDDAPLGIDSDGVRTGKVALEGFEAIAGWDLEVGEFARLIHLNQLPQGDTSDGVVAAVPFVAEKQLGVAVGEVADHGVGGRTLLSAWAGRGVRQECLTSV